MYILNTDDGAVITTISYSDAIGMLKYKGGKLYYASGHAIRVRPTISHPWADANRNDIPASVLDIVDDLAKKQPASLVEARKAAGLNP